MTQEELRERIRTILLNNGFIKIGEKGADLNTLIPNVSVFSLCSTLAARLIDNIVEIEISADPPIEKKKMQPLSAIEATNVVITSTKEISEDDRALKPSNKISLNIVLKGDAKLPKYGTPHSSGFDIAANFSDVEDYTTYAYRFNKVEFTDYIESDFGVYILPGHSAPIPTGVYIELPLGFEAMIRPRSGIATKQGLRLANCEGTVDADYSGEYIVALYNHSDVPQLVMPGMKVA